MQIELHQVDPVDAPFCSLGPKLLDGARTSIPKSLLRGGIDRADLVRSEILDLVLVLQKYH